MVKMSDFYGKGGRFHSSSESGVFLCGQESALCPKLQLAHDCFGFSRKSNGEEDRTKKKNDNDGMIIT